MRKRLRVGVALAFAGTACASAGSRPALSGAVRDVKGVNCPEERIEVVETRERDGDTVYVLDACGKRVEIARGLGIPMRKNEVTEVSAENPVEPPEGLMFGVPPATAAAVREKLGAWCSREKPADPDVIWLSASTDAELAQCRERLAALLEPLGTKLDEETGQEAYWFRLGQYLFSAQQVMYDPSDARATRHAPVQENPEDAETRRRARHARAWFGRIELGGGYVAHRSFNGGSLDLRTEIGLKATPDVGVGFAVSQHSALFGESEHQPHILEVSLVVPYYPIAGEGLRLDVNGGLALLSYDFLFEEMGALIGAGVGYDFGPRGKEDEGWTGFGLTARGYYATPGGYSTLGGILEGGMYVW